MKLKKRIEFHPKKVKITKHNEKADTKRTEGARFGNRWFPYNRD